jgi:hypothetical protein
MLFNIRPLRRGLCIVAAILLASAAFAEASATLLLEEPYGKLGFFTATGHAAVYLSGVCAETPVVLRRCNPGESGVVISRYDGVAGYDWVAIPLIPYLYAVDRPEDVPLFADAKMAAFLRDRYRREYLEDIIPDAKDGSMPGGNWYELVGSSYDRTIYGLTIETTPAQDDALIRKLNASPNQSHFHLVSRNCADFAKDVLNFYYPKTFHRSVVADVGITTPKQMAKMLYKFSQKHAEIQFSRMVIAQVPGSVPRSTAVHGVVESFFKSKKYIVPSAVVSPLFAGCVTAVFVGTGAGHFDVTRDAKVFVPGGDPEAPLDREDRRAYQEELKHILTAAYPDNPEENAGKAWEKLQSKATIAVDDQGRPVLEMQVGDTSIQVGLSAENVLERGTPSQVIRQLMEARLQSELLRRPPQGISESEIARDWKILETTMPSNQAQLTARASQRSEVVQGNRQ